VNRHLASKQVDLFFHASNAINRGDVYRFIRKPFDNNELKQAVEIAIACYEINVQSKRERISIFHQHHTAFSSQQ